MNDLKDIIYKSIERLSAKRRESNKSIRPSRVAFYFKDILIEVQDNHSNILVPKNQIKQQLMALEKEGRIKMILTCTPMFLLPENYVNYFEKKGLVKIKSLNNLDNQEIQSHFPDSKLSNDGKDLYIRMTSYHFDLFQWEHKELTKYIELIWE